jgi:hypothetical protein
LRPKCTTNHQEVKLLSREMGFNDSGQMLACWFDSTSCSSR